MAADPADFEMVAALRRVIEVLDALRIPYLIGGSVASSVHGDPRATRDIDIVAAFFPGHASPFASRLGDEFYVEPDTILSAIEHQGSFNVIHLETMVKIDVFIARNSPFSRSLFTRRHSKAIGESEALSVQLASPEDTILAKLDWYRQGGETSDRQWNDILGVLKVQAERLDRNYLDHWATDLLVADLLRKAIDDAGLDSSG